VSVVGYRKYFTPNGDGSKWNLENIGYSFRL
jgi:hypothetical protein